MSCRNGWDWLVYYDGRVITIIINAFIKQAVSTNVTKGAMQCKKVEIGLK